MTPTLGENILQEAQRITSQDRARTYGSALADARRWAQVCSALIGLEVRPEHFPLVMLAVKLSRLSQACGCWHRDSVVDIAGYARVAEKIFDERCEEDDIEDAQRAIREAA
jgi:hypothetical protein